MSNASEDSHTSSLAGLTLGAIGVVYGDIGTSVLYSIKEVFGSGHVAFTPDNVMGILSIFFWTLTFIVSIKYVTLVLRADNNGEGGLVAMLALASSSVKDKPKLRSVLLVVGIFGTCLFYGDGVITPAISVLSAVEGLEVVMFKTSSNLAAAYGIAVCTDMLITTILTFFVIRYAWKYPMWLCICATAIFFLVDLAFWSSNLLKLVDGGWFPLFIGGLILILMLTWRDGRQLLHHKTRDEAMDLRSFLDALFTAPPTRVEGTAVFLTTEDDIVPNAMLHNLKHNKVLHAQNLFVSVRSHEVPWIAKDKRTELIDLGHNCWQVKVHYGFKDDPDVPFALSLLRGKVGSINGMNTSYFLSRDSIVPTVGGGMAQWREKLFAQMYLNASAAADFLNLPSNSVVEMGSKIEI